MFVLKPPDIAGQNHQFGSQLLLRIARCNDRLGDGTVTQRRPAKNEPKKAVHPGPGQSSLTLCSTGPALVMVHSVIDPSYILAFLLPISSLETNQPTEAQWPVLQKLI